MYGIPPRNQGKVGPGSRVERPEYSGPIDYFCQTYSCQMCRSFDSAILMPLGSEKMWRRIFSSLFTYDPITVQIQPLPVAKRRKRGSFFAHVAAISGDVSPVATHKLWSEMRNLRGLCYICRWACRPLLGYGAPVTTRNDIFYDSAAADGGKFELVRPYQYPDHCRPMSRCLRWVA